MICFAVKVTCFYSPGRRTKTFSEKKPMMLPDCREVKMEGHEVPAVFVIVTRACESEPASSTEMAGAGWLVALISVSLRYRGQLCVMASSVPA